MIEDENWLFDILKEQRGKAKKKKRRGKIIKIIGSMAPFLLVILCVVLLGSGLVAAFSVVSSFISGIFGGTDAAATGGMTRTQMEEYVAQMSDEEILELVKSDKIDASFYEMMMINQEELQYLLEQVIAYNNNEVVRTIEIECEHTYRVWVEDEATPAVPGAAGSADSGEEQATGHYETRTEYVYRPLMVNSASIETFDLDWQLVYALCLTDTMNGVEEWTRGEPEIPDGEGELTADSEKGELSHYGPDHEEIDLIIDNVKMQYDYVTDLARDTKIQYSMEECEALVHTTYEYGDPNTEEGSWKYYYPHSVLSRAYSGYSCMYYIISEDGNSLEYRVNASDMYHFERIVECFCKRYNFGYFSSILKFIPGGKELAERFDLYYANMERGYNISITPLSGYEIGSGIDKSLLPTSREWLSTDFGDLTDWGDLAYDENIGGDIVREAMSKVGCAYDQSRRWEEGYYDCSSFVWRVLQAVGIDISSICVGSTAAAECKGMVEAGMVISENDMQQGDIIFYSSGYNGRYRNVTHVAIYAGGGKIVHAKGKRYGVVVGDFYRTGLVCVCRPYNSTN